MPMIGRKPIPKKEVMKLKPGTLLRIMWDDSHDEFVMLLEKPERVAGDISLYYMRSNGKCESFATHRQVVEVSGKISWESEFEPESET